MLKKMVGVASILGTCTKARCLNINTYFAVASPLQLVTSIVWQIPANFYTKF